MTCVTVLAKPMGKHFSSSRTFLGKTGTVSAFNGKVRDEKLNRQIIHTPGEAQVMLVGSDSKHAQALD